MITKRISTTIFTNYIKSSPEQQEFLKLKEKITNLISTRALEILTLEEKYFMEHYPNYVYLQDDINLGCLYNILHKDRLPSMYSNLVNLGNLEVFNYDIGFSNFNKKFPRILTKDYRYYWSSSGDRESLIKDLDYAGEDFKNEFCKLLEEIKKVCEILYKKLQILEELLVDSEIKLKDIEKFYPKLYEHYKSK